MSDERENALQYALKLREEMPKLAAPSAADRHVVALLDLIEEYRYAELEHEHLGCHVAKTGIYADRQAPRPEVGTSIGDLKDIYTIAQYVGIPGTKIDSFVKTAAMAGYILVRATVSTPEPQKSGVTE